MTQRKLSLLAIALIAGCLGCVLAVDLFFKAAVSDAGLSDQDRSQSVMLARNGFLTSRRAVHLICLPDGRARVVTKARFAHRAVTPGTKGRGGINLAEWDRRGRPDVSADVAMTLVSMDWVDTLESDVLPSESVGPLVTGIRNPKLDFIGVHALEHGLYFHRDGSTAGLQALDSCSSG